MAQGPSSRGRRKVWFYLELRRYALDIRQPPPHRAGLTLQPGIWVNPGPHLAPALLDGMGDLVGQQFQARLRIRVELVPPEEDIGPRCEGDRVYALGQFVGFRVVVDPHATEVMVQSLFQVTPHRSREGIPTSTPGLDAL